MQHLLRLCLWQAIIIGILTAHFPVSAEEERGIRMRGPKSTDVFPYDRYGPIISKDTLWNIATRIRPDARLSVYQVMQALYQENPQAFVDSNINHLVEGQYLKIPSFNNMMAINTNSAKKKSENDHKSWQKSQPKATKKLVITEPSVKKKDLETVKTEINDQLQKIDGQQQKRLENIQNDISDSIDGLQAILKENDDLRQRLTSFNDKLGIMQDEVAKGKEIKLQMDDMIKLQQALLAKAEAREKELLLLKQQAELAEQDITSSLWFKIVMGSLPAILILGLLAFLFNRRKQASDEVFFNELDSKKQASAVIKESPAEEFSLDNELSLDDELDLSLDDELNFDDELNLDDELDLSLDDELNLDDELDLSLDDELGLDDDLSIDLIDDDDSLDDLEDILLDDDNDVLDGGELDQGDLDSLLSGLDDELDSDEEPESEELDGGELDQGDLDSLLSGLDDELDNNEEPESEELEGGELNQDDLNDLLGGLTDLNDDDLAVEDPIVTKVEEKAEAADVTDPDDIDALLASVANTAPVVEEKAETAEVTDPDDIDALLASVANTAPVVEEKAEAADVTDPDDIDALLASVANTAPVVEEKAETAEVTDPDDIDALLASVANSAPPAEEKAETAEVTDPDDIDALLASVANTEPVVEEKAETAEVTDPDDIDALLASVANTAPVVEEKAEAAEVTDPDDIDALLASVANTAPVVEEKAETAEVTDPDDIDALLASVANSSPPAEEKAADVTDPDDIDALLDSVANSAAAVEQPIAEKVEDVDITDPDDIDALLESMSGNAPAVEQPIAEKAEDIDITDPDDIDALLESMSGNVPAPQQDVPATMSEPKSDMEMGEQSDIDKTMEKGSTLNAEEQRIQEEIAENEAKIAEFTAEYVTPFLTADFSDIMAKESEVKLDPETLGSNDVDELDDDLDIDALIADTISKDEASQRIQQDEREDIGDNLTGSSIDETLNNQVDDGFTESELSQLLADESLEIDAEQVDEISTESIALSPDFNDEDILAELLAETHDAEEDNLEEIEELDVIGELDDVDFDELLANIEEESAARSVEQDEIEQPLDDIGDDLIDNSLGEEGIQSDQTVEPRENYVSVDDLLTESLGEIDKSEPYEKTNIDVGLGQFSQNESGVDVDENGSMSSQLDLAKMYIEMSDEENAQVILQEVLSKGDVIQKIEAQELLDSL